MRKSRQKLKKILENFLNGNSFCHLGQYDFKMADFLPKLPGHTAYCSYESKQE